MEFKINTKYKIIVSIIFGLLGFVVNFYSINFPFPPYTATVLIGLLFPMLIALTWGWRYGLLSALAGGCQSIWWIWGPSNGYAIFTIVPPFTLWILWHGFFAEMRRKSDDRKWWQNMYVVEIPFRILTTINLLTLARWAVSLNPPPWVWASEATNIITMEFSIFCVIKQFVVGYVILLLADVLLNIEFTRRFFGLEKRPGHTDTGYIISFSLLLGVIFWVIDSVIGSVIFYPESSFIDLLALNVPPVVIYVRTFFILACLAGGLIFSKLLHKHFEIGNKFKYLYSMVRLMCDNLPDLIWTKDLKNRFIFVNKSCCEILLNAKDTDEPIGKDDLYFAKREKASHPENPDYHTFGETYTDSDLMIIETKKPMRGDESGNLKGENITLDVYKAPFLDDNNNMMGTVGFARDITKEKEIDQARKQAEEELEQYRDNLEELIKERTADSEESRQALVSLVEDLGTMTDELTHANNRLQELDMMKSMFIATTSHELRTPLNSIIGFTSVLLEGWSGDLNPEQKEQLGIVLTSGKYLLALINDVIDISKIEAGKLEVYIEQFNLGDVVKEASSLIKTDLDEKGLTLTADVPDITIDTDRRRLLQCIINLLSNAMKFTEKGSITIEAKTINDIIDISIIDTGIGIKEEDIPKLFTAFVRLESHLTDITSGTGLGLYLTDKLAQEVLGGTIDVTSKHGEGSTFTLHIPITQGIES
ncbi:MAG TPA: hypothetical protein C5S51_09595 [Methanosarcinaceae archaeon]|nr:hypothetical protein [Methanosarcinaceae archaeon]